MAIPTTLPSSWYYSQGVHQLERTAIFLRSWFFLGTITKFQIGETARFEIAQIVLIVKVTGSEQDRSIEVFDEAADQEVRSYKTPSGLVFTTISSEAPPFEEYYPGLEDLINTVDFTQIPHRRTLSYPGNFNWKTLIDGFQECLHCQFAHPGLSKLYPPSFYHVENHHNWSQHFASPDCSQDGLFLFFFPNCSLNMYNGGMSIFRVCPTIRPGVSRMEFDYYNTVSGQAFEDYYKFVRQVATEDFDLCERTQANLENGVYTEGCLNPEKESGVVHYQGRVFDLIRDEHNRGRKPKITA